MRYTPPSEMAGERTKLIVQTREKLGSRETRRLRRQGIVPGVLYGGGEPVAIRIEERELRRALTGAAGLHSILDVEIDGTGKSHASILKDYQVDKVRGGVIHVDLHEVRLDRPITASVSVHLLRGDEAPGVKEGGVLSQPLREVQVEALPLGDADGDGLAAAIEHAWHETLLAEAACLGGAERLALGDEQLCPLSGHTGAEL